MQHQDSEFAHWLEILEVRERLMKSLAVNPERPVYLREHLDPRRVNALVEGGPSLDVHIQHVFNQELRFAGDIRPLGVIEIVQSLDDFIEYIIFCIALERQ